MTLYQSDAQPDVKATSAPKRPAPAAAAPPRRVWLERFSVNNMGAVYVLLLICIIFSIWAPSTFPHWATVKQVLDSYAITAMAALALIVPLSARTFDLSFAYTMSLSGVTAAHFVVKDNMSVGFAMLLGIGAALIIGLINGFVVVVLRVDSFIGTLGTGSLVQAFISFVTKENPINSVKLAGTFTKVSQTSVGGFVYVVFWALALAIVLWLFMEYTATGRRLYAAGFNPEAARLANIRVDRLRFGALMTSAGIAGFAGVMLASSLSAGSPTAGTSYLLPAFAAAFVGATQFKRGRFNSWGTIVAILMLGTGVVGLGLVSAPLWAQDMFTGVVLLVALAATGFQRRTLWRGGTSALRAMLRRQPAVQ